MTNRLKEKYGYRLNYDVKLNNGKTFKTTEELNRLKEKLSIYTDSYKEEDREEVLKKIQKRIDNKKRIINELKVEKEELMEKKSDFDSGIMDEGFDIELKQKIEDKKERKEIKKAKIHAIKETNKGISKDFYEKSVQSSRNDRYKLKNINHEYKYFVGWGNTLPKVYSKKLRNMTNNNGYLWKRVYFYGMKPTVPGDNTRTIYELFRDKTVIHFKDNGGNWEKTTKYKNKYINNNTNRYTKKHNFSFKNT